MTEARKPAKPALDPAIVQEFVAKGHSDLARIQALLAEYPTLLNAAWDWGGGDWETAIGAAAHVGRRDIAEFLLTKGARIDIFVAAMLGKLDLVKAILAVFPEQKHILGPHNIPLIVHAQMGGEAATAVVDFLQNSD